MNMIQLAEETGRTLPASPVAFGLISFGFLAAALWFVLQWNKGR